MLLLNAAAVAGVARLSFDSSLKSLTVPDDPARQFLEQTNEIFGDQEIGVVALLADDVYTPAVLGGLRELTERIAAVDGVQKVLSLANAHDPAADVFNPPPLMAGGTVTAAIAKHVRERVAANPIYEPHLVAADGRAAAVNVFLTTIGDVKVESRIDRAIEAVLAAYDGPGELYYSGRSHVRVRAVELMRTDLLRFLPLSLLCMMIVLWLSFGSFRAVVLPLASIALGVAGLMGVMGWLQTPITITTLILPSLLLVIGGSYSVHVMAAILEAAAEETSSDGERRSVLRRIGLPVALSALTTAVGFGSLAFHPIPAISRLGIFAVIGIVVMAVGCLFGLPLAFRVFPPRPGSSGKRGSADVAYLRLLDRVLQRLVGFAVDHRRLVFLVAAATAIACALGAGEIRIDTDFLTAFRPSSDVRVAHDVITERLAGPNPFSIVITGPVPGYFKSIAPLRRVKELQAFMKEIPGIDATISLVDYLQELDLGLQASGGGLVVNDEGDVVEAPPPPSFWDAPKEQLPAIFELVALSPKTFSGVVDPEFRRIRITARTSVSGSHGIRELVDQIQTYAEAMFPAGVEVQATGNIVVMSNVADRVLSGQIESLGLAFSVIFAVLVFLFLSVRVGGAAMVPNVLPVLVFFGVMGATGVELNLATSIIGAVALGIAVDDTIHYMARLNRIVKLSESQRDALLLTMAAVGRPVVFTSVTLMAGFLVMVLSSFTLISAFGWLSAATMLVALVTNVVLLPGILATVPVISVWDLVAFRLGPSAHRNIPLFEGLGRLAVRLIVLLGTLKSFTKGETIVRRGEPGREMYLLLTGNAEVVVDDGRVLAELGRGDVVGEMALLRQAVRSADVVASSDVEVLVIDEDFLRRLRIRYPRFASRFFLNIARILSDRLEEANRRLGVIH